MRKKKGQKPVFFAFATSRSPEQVLSTIYPELIEFNAEHDLSLYYHVPKESKNRFHIGLERDGHSSGGYWYCANMQVIDGMAHISGRILYNPDQNDVEHPKEKPALWEWIGDAILWVILIPVLLAAGCWRLYCLIAKKRWDYKKEEKLMDFMTNNMGCTLIEQR